MNSKINGDALKYETMNQFGKHHTTSSRGSSHGPAAKRIHKEKKKSTTMTSMTTMAKSLLSSTHNHHRHHLHQHSCHHEASLLESRAGSEERDDYLSDEFGTLDSIEVPSESSDVDNLVQEQIHIFLNKHDDDKCYCLDVINHLKVAILSTDLLLSIQTA